MSGVTKGNWTRSGVLNKSLEEALKKSKVHPSSERLIKKQKELYGQKRSN